MSRRSYLAAFLALAVASCTTTRSDLEATLCDFQADRPESQRLGHILQSGQALPGEIDIETYREWTNSVPSAMARPINDVIEKEYRKDCFDKKGNYWYPCVETIEIDLSQVRGIARAMDLDRAGTYAIRLCQRLTKAAVPPDSGLPRESPDLYCRVSQRQTCPLPTP